MRSRSLGNCTIAQNLQFCRYLPQVLITDRFRMSTLFLPTLSKFDDNLKEQAWL